jgi:hypothetical protein
MTTRALVAMFLITLLVTAGTAQERGSLEVSGRVQIGKERVALKRKRFFLFRGGLAANKALVEKIRSSEYMSRDCYYCREKASAEFLAWLKAEDCETPYCRQINEADIAKVPEFQAAHRKGLIQFRNRRDVALKWLTTNLTPNLRDGFYRQQRSAIDSILAQWRPLQSSMTDSVSVKAIFIDVPVQLAAGKTTETFLVSNLVPTEHGGKGYLWACEVEVGTAKRATLILRVPEPGKQVPRCEVVVKDLPACSPASCPKT